VNDASEESGEVAVRERGQVTAIDCSRLDGQISICLDGGGLLTAILAQQREESVA
jgi:hypothetical protein